MSEWNQFTQKEQLAGRAVKTYLRCNPTFGYLKDDLRSEAKLALIRCLRNGLADDDKIVNSIYQALAAMIDREANTVRVPASTRREAKRKGKPIAPIQCVSLTEDIADERQDGLFNDILDSCRSEREREIVRMLAAGHTNEECAAKFGIHPGQLSRIIAEIERRCNSDVGTDTPYESPKGNGANGLCRCGAPAARWNYGNDDRCEDCWADDQQRYSGRSQSVNTLGSGPRQTRSQAPCLEAQPASEMAVQSGSRAAAQWSYIETSYATSA